MKINIENLANKKIKDRAYDVYHNGYVSIIDIGENIEGYLKIEARITGTNLYTTKIMLDENKVIDYSCSCPYHFGGACKHVIALCYEFDDMMQRNLRESQQNHLNREIEPIKQVDNLELGEEFINILYKHDKNLVNNYNSVEVKIGEKDGFYGKSIELEFYLIENGQKYHIPNIVRFINAYRFKKEYCFRKMVLYSPDKNRFNQYTNFVLQYLIDYIDKNYIKDRNLAKNWRVALDMIDKFNRYGIKIFTENGYFDKSNRYKLDFIIEDNGDKVSLINKNKGEIMMLHNFIYQDNSLYYLSYEDKNLIGDLLDFFKKTDKIEFLKEKISDYTSILNRYSKSIRYVEGDIKSLGLEEIEMKFYFDKDDENNLIATIKTYYKSEEIDIFNDNLEILGKDKVLKEIEKYLYNHGFIGEKGDYILENDDLIYEFLSNQLKFLKKRGGVYFSKEFDAMIKLNHFPISTHLNYGDKKSIDIRFSLEGVKDINIDNIIKARRNNEKYIRLKNGSFIDLKNKNFEKFEKMMNDLEIDNLINLNLPPSSLLYINLKMEKMNIGKIEKSKEINNYLTHFNKQNKFKLREDYKKILRDYQKEGVDWLSKMAKYNLGGILADDMGLGKTLQVLAFLNSQKEIGKSLIVVPKSLIYNWEREINKFSEDIDHLVIDGDKKSRESLIKKIKDKDLIIISYSLLRQDIEEFSKFNFEYIFIDEAQHIKNPRALITKAVKRIKAVKRFAMTGTPLENRVDELWSIFDYIMPTYLGSLGKFNKKYGRLETKSLEDLKLRVHSFIIRRTKNEVLKELPEKLETEIYVELNNNEKSLYKAYVDKFLNDTDIKKDKLEILTILLKLRQICCHKKLINDKLKGKSSKEEATIELIEDAIDGGHKILLFSQFTSMLKILEESLKNKNIKTFYLDGQTPSKKRLDLVDRFNSGEAEVFLISLKAGGTGLNLTGADMVIHYDPWWNPAVEDQASDRVYRIGQKKKVQIIKMVTRGTIEEKIFDIQKGKKELSDNILDVNNKNKILQKDLIKLLSLK